MRTDGFSAHASGLTPVPRTPLSSQEVPSLLQCSSNMRNTLLQPPKGFGCWLGSRAISSLAAGSQSPRCQACARGRQGTSWLSAPGHAVETPPASETVFSRKHRPFPEDQAVRRSILISDCPRDREVAEGFSARGLVVAWPKQN